MTTSVLVAGAATGCWTNLGDEAVMASMVGAFRAAWPDASISIVSSNPEGFLDRYDCQAIPFRDVDAIVKATEASDLVVLGGGSIFFDYWGSVVDEVLTPRHKGLSLWTGIALLAAAHDKPLMIYGAGVGPLTSDEGALLTGTIFELAQAARLRDRGSLALLSSLGLSGGNTGLSADPALGARLPAVQALELPRPWLGVALRQWDIGVNDTDWKTATAAALDDFLARHGGTAIFVPAHRGVSWPLTDDTAAANAVRGRMQLVDQTHLVDIELPWQQRAALLTRCDQVLAMRYHAALFALSAGVPTVSLSYDPKVSNLMDEWGMSAFCLSLHDAGHEAITSRLNHAFRDHPSLAARAADRVEELRQLERRNIQQAMDLVSNGIPSRGRGPKLNELLVRLRRTGVARSTIASNALDRLVARTSSGCQPIPRKRVAILTNLLLDRETGKPCVGGAERYALELGRLLRDIGLEPVFFQREGAWDQGDFFGFPVLSLPREEWFSEFETGVAKAFHERTQSFDHAVYLAPNYASGPIRDDAIVVCHGVWWDHDFYRNGFSIRTDEWYQHLEKVFSRPERIVSVDANSINVVRALFPGAAKRMRLIPNWVDCERFHPPAERFGDTPLVLFPRRAVPVRGVHFVEPLLEMLQEDCRVVWVGDGGAAKRLREIEAKDERFEFRTAHFEEMPDIYRSADICVIPSAGSEGQSLSCLEAMASGCAVVATNVGGLPELIQDGVNGLLCDPTPKSLAASVRRLLRDSELRRRLGRAAHASAQHHSHMTWRNNWAELVAEAGWVEHSGLADPYDIICFSIIDWEFRWQRPQQMMALWGKRGRRVFYLNRSTFLDLGDDPIVVRPLAHNVWEVQIALSEPFKLFSGTHPPRFVEDGLDALAALRERFGIEKAVALTEYASWMPLAGAARDAFGWPLVYDCMDDWTTFPGDHPKLRELEETLVASADRMVVSAQTIAERWEGKRSGTLLARNAADFDFFNQPGNDDPLPGVKGPVAGFFGAVAEWFDYTLMKHVAQARPEVTFVFVGGVHRTSVEDLEVLPNVIFEGFQPYEKMPLYLRRFDVCLVPFEVSPVTDGVDAVKLYEYLSQGKPVVSTRIREIIRYDDLIYLAADRDEFLQQLDRALNEDSSELRERRIDFARQNNWNERLDRIEEAIRELFPGTAP
jgi:polysaccharide pyruvyl transferase CsaB